MGDTNKGTGLVFHDFFVLIFIMSDHMRFCGRSPHQVKAHARKLWTKPKGGRVLHTTNTASPRGRGRSV